MKYWVYINDKVEGPFDEDKLVTLQGFTQDTLICSEDTANSGNQEWVKASSIFEFDQVSPASAEPSQPITQTASTGAAADGLAAVLLAKLDALTAQISGLQTKLDGMQTKLDDAISTQNKTATSNMMAPSMPPMDDTHANTITLTRHDIEAQVEEVLPPSQDEEKPLDMLGPVDLGEHGNDDFSSKAGEDVVVSAALDSLYNARLQDQAQQDINESTFQDLLTPHQAAELAKTADAALAASEEQERTLDEALKQVEKKANDPAEKDKLIDSFSTASQPDVVDQLIQEKEEEKETSSNSGAGLALAGAAALGIAGAAALSSLNNSPEDNKSSEETQSTNPSEVPALPTESAEPAEPTLPAEQNRPDMAHEDKLPSLDDADKPISQDASSDANESTTPEELVPGANLEKKDGELITEEDLKDAFTERQTQEDQSVEQLFGIAGNTTANTPSSEDVSPEDAKMESLDDLKNDNQTSSQERTNIPSATSNPNELTEIELKEGSTYLISDFVPPAQASQDVSQELANRETPNTAVNTEKSSSKNSAEETDAEELVSLKTQFEKPVETPKNIPEDVTVSQVILENTIKTKRGASLDIKTVPMVPEPGESQRLHLEGMDDDLNTQHDLQEADIKPASKTTKAVILSLVTILLIAVLYALLAFLHILPAQFNIFSSDKAVAEQQAQQNAQLEEMLAPEEAVTDIQPTEEIETSTESTDPAEAVLEEVKAYSLPNGYTLKDFIENKHASVKDLITWEISTAIDPDNYSVLVKVPPENPQSFKISYRFNYNAVTKTLEPTISDAKNLLDEANGSSLPVTPVQ